MWDSIWEQNTNFNLSIIHHSVCCDEPSPKPSCALSFQFYSVSLILSTCVVYVNTYHFGNLIFDAFNLNSHQNKKLYKTIYCLTHILLQTFDFDFHGNWLGKMHVTCSSGIKSGSINNWFHKKYPVGLLILFYNFIYFFIYFKQIQINNQWFEVDLLVIKFITF